MQEVAEKRKQGDEARRAWESKLHQRQITEVVVARVSDVIFKNTLTLKIKINNFGSFYANIG